MRFVTSKKFILSLAFLTFVFFPRLVWAGEKQLIFEDYLVQTGVQMVSRYQNFTDHSDVSENMIENVVLKAQFDNECGIQLVLTNTSLATKKSAVVTTTPDVALYYQFNFATSTTFTEASLSKWTFDGVNYDACTVVGDYSGAILGSNDANSYTKGDFDSGAQTLKDMFFMINPYVNDTVSSIRFRETPESTCYFNNWNTLQTFSSSTMADALAGNYSVQVQWGVGSNLQFQDWAPWDPAFFKEAKIPHTADELTGLDFFEDLAMTAKASICSSNNPENCDWEADNDYTYFVAESDPWDFIIATTTTKGDCLPGGIDFPKFDWPFPNATSTDPSNNITCDPNSGFFASSMCNLFQYLFVPKASDFERWKALKTTLENKPPFGYFVVFNNAIDGLSSATSTSSTIQMASSTPMFSTLANLEIWETLQTLLEYFLWFLFLLYIYRRFKNFSLHG